MAPEELEKILDKNAKKIMIDWSLKSFKLSHPKLFRTIINSMEEVSKQNEKNI